MIMAQTNEVAARKLPGSLETNRRLDRWLKINSDGTVTVTPGKVEIGQGILTALVQIVAEELDIDVARIRLAPATTAYSPDEGITSGSRSIQDSGLALRHAAAEVRGLLLEEAARKLDVTLEQLTVTDGVVSARSGGSVPYWELATPELLARESSVDVSAKMPAEHVVVGTSLSRVDIPGKVTGKPSYVQDMKLPGMLHGRVSRPPGPRARVAPTPGRRTATSISPSRGSTSRRRWATRSPRSVRPVWITTTRRVRLTDRQQGSAVTSRQRDKRACRSRSTRAMPTTTRAAFWRRRQRAAHFSDKQSSHTRARAVARVRGTWRACSRRKLMANSSTHGTSCRSRRAAQHPPPRGMSPVS